MKSQFNRTWLLVAIMVVINIGIFKALSNKLEVYVVDSITSSITENN